MLPEPAAYSCLSDDARARILNSLTGSERITFAYQYAAYLQHTMGVTVTPYNVLMTFHAVMNGRAQPISTREVGR